MIRYTKFINVLFSPYAVKNYYDDDSFSFPGC